jgi:hypothetical protein
LKHEFVLDFKIKVFQVYIKDKGVEQRRAFLKNISRKSPGSYLLNKNKAVNKRQIEIKVKKQQI